MTSDAAEIVTCPSCGAANRVRSGLRPGSRAVCGRCRTTLRRGADAARPVVVGDQNYADEVERSPVPVLIDLWAEWCAPCRAMAPVLEELAGELAGRVRVAKLNVDENPRAAARFNLHSIPTLVLVAGGREIDRLIGLHAKVEIRRWLEAAVARVS